MRHYGDITKLHGYELPIVDCITGGSPCQDLSVAGARAGLAGERSGLFMEQIRIVKEMRDADRATGRTGLYVRPRFMVWENVPGSFSSNKGKDFQAVLTEIVRIIEPDSPDVPMPEKGKWPKSGCLYDDMGGWSVAWRVHDAQFWGVPQRRKRIAVVADFGGLTAPEVLFERKGLSRDIKQSQKARKTHSERIGDCIGKTGGGGIVEAYSIEGHIVDRESKQNGLGIKEGVSQTLNATDRHAVIALHILQDPIVANEISPCISQGSPHGQACCATYRFLGYGEYKEDKVHSTLKARDSKDATDLIVSVDCRNMTESEVNGTLQAKTTGGQSVNLQNTYRRGDAVYRYTPLECERLQGYPDGWTDIGEWVDSKGKKHKGADSPRYKALGNSIALPFWLYLLRRISAQYERPAKLGSLFDGIGGFPLCWERCNGPGTAIWASEIEEFPMAVTRQRFPED